MSLEGLAVVFVSRAVIRPTRGADEGRVEVGHRVVRRVARRRSGRGGRVGDLAAQVGMYGPSGILELADRTTRHVLDDRLQVPARPATGRTVDRRLFSHGLPPVRAPV